jgi:anti-sigma factor RsiW
MKTTDEKLISRGMDGALRPEERERLEQLRVTDSEARQTEQIWMALGDQIRTVPVSPPDAAVAWQDIRRAIRQQEADPSTAPNPFLFRLKWAGGLAGLGLAAVLGFYAWQMMRSSGAMVADADGTQANRVEWVVAEIPGATTMIYTDTETDLTVIWMDVAQSADPRDT